MPQVVNKRGDVICVIGLLPECPDCGTLCEGTECPICGWTVPAEEEAPPPPRPTPPKPAAKREQAITDHIDASSDTACMVCNADRVEIGGVMQCPVCGPTPGMAPPEEPPPAPKALPNIDDQLPADPRCPKCLEMAEGTSADSPVTIGEREIAIDFMNGGAVSLVCPVCNHTEQLWDGKQQPVAATVAEETKQAGRHPEGHEIPPEAKSPDSGSVASVPGAKEIVSAERPPLEVRRRKKG
jgi:hypothetical protein